MDTIGVVLIFVGIALFVLSMGMISPWVFADCGRKNTDDFQYDANVIRWAGIGFQLMTASGIIFLIGFMTVLIVTILG